MNDYDEDEVYYHLGEGCMIHGEEFMRECPSCGNEFCARCDGGPLCEDCAMEAEEESFDDQDDPDFEDVDDLDELLEEDSEVERILEDEEDIPEEDLQDEDEEFEEEDEDEDYEDEDQEEDDY